MTVIGTPKTKPFPIRLTEVERNRLEVLAGSQPLGTYIKSVIFEVGASRRTQRRPVVDQTSLAQLLAMIGRSEIAAHLDVLSAAAANGTLLIDDETTESIQSACAEVHAIHALLMRALGFQEDRS